MTKPLEVNISFTSDFRQVILKLANIYNPNFDFPTHFDNVSDLIDAISECICKDFSNQLYPLLHEKITEKVYQQLP